MGASIQNQVEVSDAFKRQQAQWHGVVKNLAEAFSCPLSEVEKALSTAAHELEQGARIKDFIPVLAIKQVRDQLKPYQHTPHHEQHALNHP